MKKIISFEKELDFPSMIGEITSISLDHDLEFIDSNTISGEFKIKGTYKMTEASTLEEDFYYEIPVDINLIETFDLNNVKIGIDNFYYEILNEDILKCNIDVLIDGIEEVTIEENEVDTTKIESLETRECDGDKSDNKEIEVEEMENLETIIPEQEIQETEDTAFKQIDNIEQLNKEKKEESEIILEKNEDNNNISSLFEAFESTEETFKTYSVYILRQDDTIEAIMDKYKVTKEELSDYNDLNNLEIGTKLIIPTTIDE